MFNKDNRDRKPVEMHDAVCAECGNNCQVPFKPTGDKPIKCSDCFKKTNDGGPRGGRGGFNDRPKPAPRTDYTKQLEGISAKMDKIIRLLETGTLERPEGTAAQRGREERKEEQQTVDAEALQQAISESKK